MELETLQTANIPEELRSCQYRLNIEFRNLSYVVTSGRGRRAVQLSILKNTNGKFQSGHLTAIIGPSGAGKTTLLNVLSGFKTSGTSGTVTVNGMEQNMSQFRKLSCYITQDFAMLNLLTTQETLMIAMDLKLGSTIGKAKKSLRVNNILQILGLEKTKNTLVGKLSGGERKRLSIGVELLTNPPVMFIDEPTSGLDSSSSLQVISHLKSLAQAGRTVVCSIHQPSSQLIEMFDDLYILSEGQCLYNGPIDDMISVFAEAGYTCPNYYNRADFAIEVACKPLEDGTKELVKRCCEEFCKNITNNDEASLMAPTLTITKDTAIKMPRDEGNFAFIERSTSSFLQFVILTKRSLLCTFRDVYMTYLRFCTFLIVGFLLGAMCYNIGNEASKIPSNIAFIFFTMLFVLILSPLLTVLVFPMEAAVFLREQQNNWYTLRAYYFSKIVSDTPLQILSAVVFIFPSYFLTNQPYDVMRLVKFSATCLLLALTGQSMGFVSGSAFDAQMALFTVVAYNIPMMLFSGFYMRINDIPIYLRWLSDVSYFRYGFQATLLSIYGDNRTSLICSEDVCHYKYPLQVLEDYHLSDGSCETALEAILMWYIVSQILFYVVLKCKLYLLR